MVSELRKNNFALSELENLLVLVNPGRCPGLYYFAPLGQKKTLTFIVIIDYDVLLI